MDGPGKFPEPCGPLGEAREQAAAMIGGVASYKTLDKIGYLEQAATDANTPLQPPSRMRGWVST